MTPPPPPSRAEADSPQDETLFRVLRTLEARPETSQRELADSLGVSLGKANYCLKALVDKGLVKVRNFRNSKNKLAYAYVLTPSGVAAKAALSGRFLKRKMAEYEALRQEIEELRRDAGEGYP